MAQVLRQGPGRPREYPPPKLTAEEARIKGHIERAIRLFDSQRNLQAATGFSHHAIWRARNIGRVSGPMAVAIETATKGEVTAAQLCPRLFGGTNGRRRQSAV